MKSVIYVIHSTEGSYQVTKWLLDKNQIRSSPHIIHETNSHMYLVSLPYVCNILKFKKRKKCLLSKPCMIQSWAELGSFYRMNLEDSLQNKPGALNHSESHRDPEKSHLKHALDCSRSSIFRVTGRPHPIRHSIWWASLIHLQELGQK